MRLTHFLRSFQNVPFFTSLIFSPITIKRKLNFFYSWTYHMRYIAGIAWKITLAVAIPPHSWYITTINITHNLNWFIQLRVTRDALEPKCMHATISTFNLTYCGNEKVIQLFIIFTNHFYDLLNSRTNSVASGSHCQFFLVYNLPPVLGSSGFDDNWCVCDDFRCWDWDFEVSWLALDCGLESMMIVGCVVNDALVSVRVDERVLALDCTMDCGLWLALDVSGVVIVNAIVEVVVGWCLWFLPLVMGWCWCPLDSCWFPFLNCGLPLLSLPFWSLDNVNWMIGDCVIARWRNVTGAWSGKDGKECDKL